MHGTRLKDPGVVCATGTKSDIYDFLVFMLRHVVTKCRGQLGSALPLSCPRAVAARNRPRRHCRFRRYVDCLWAMSVHLITCLLFLLLIFSFLIYFSFIFSVENSPARFQTGSQGRQIITWVIICVGSFCVVFLCLVIYDFVVVGLVLCQLA